MTEVLARSSTPITEKNIRHLKCPDPLKMVGILPDWAIKECLMAGVIQIDPLDEDWTDRISQVTIDFRLGHHIRVFQDQGLNTIDTRYTSKEEIEKMMPLQILKENQPFIFTHEDFVITTTLENLVLPDDIVGTLHGRSSLARLGMMVHSTAARFDPGWSGHPVLEFGTSLLGKKIVLYPRMKICAFSFERLAASVEKPLNTNPNRKYGSNLPEVCAIAQDNNGKGGQENGY